MILECFSVRDRVVDAFLPPFFARSKGEAVRSFMEAVLDEKRAFFAHKDDYVLYHLGSFDDSSGGFSSTGAVSLMSGLEVGAT